MIEKRPTGARLYSLAESRQIYSLFPGNFVWISLLWGQSLRINRVVEPLLDWDV
jgi:hypothetical protein